MKIIKCSGFGSAIDKIIKIMEQSKLEKEAAGPGFAVDQQQKATGLPIPAGPYGPQLQQHWQGLMKQHGNEINKMGEWAAKMGKQPMVAKDPKLSASLAQFGQLIAGLPNSPQSIPQLQQQIQVMHVQLQDFWLKWQKAYQTGHTFMSDSTTRLKAFDAFVGKILNIKGFQNAATPIADPVQPAAAPAASTMQRDNPIERGNQLPKGLTSPFLKNKQQAPRGVKPPMANSKKTTKQSESVGFGFGGLAK
jgi:hypothetical protein